MNIELKKQLKKQYHQNHDLKEYELKKSLDWLKDNFKNEREKQAYIAGFEQGFGVLDVQDRNRVYREFVK